MRTCTICEVPQDDSQFKVKRNGKVNANCQTCINKIKAYYQENKEKKLKYQLDRYYTKAKDYTNQYGKKWRKNNPGYHREYTKQYHKKMYGVDARYTAIFNARKRTRTFLKRKDQDSYSDELGCTVAQLKQHLEQFFGPGMTWSNRGKRGWEVDHHFPLSKAYDAGPDAFKKALNYKNLRPRWWTDNAAKLSSIPGEYKSVDDFLRSW
jgi:hypothetical protein